MNKAKLIKTGLLKGNANLYQLDPPYKEEHDFIIVSRADTPDHGDEVMAFSANSDGDVIDWVELTCLRAENSEETTHTKALKNLGYEEE